VTKRYLIELPGEADLTLPHGGARVTVHPTLTACPVCGKELATKATGAIYCTARPDHRWEMPVPYLLPEVETGKGHGFAYGYGGTGPAVLAASLVADLFSETPTNEQFRQGACRAFLHMEPLKWRFVASLDGEVDRHWLEGDELLTFCREHEQPCSACNGTGKDPEAWCSVCGVPQGSPCAEEDGEGNPTPHEFTPAACYACLGIAVQRAPEVRTTLMDTIRKGS
jgi:hypothetical protein